MKNNYYCTWIFVCLFCYISHSQQWQWAKDMNKGSGFDIITDLNGNYYVWALTKGVYDTTSVTCGNTGVIAKHNSAGNIIWSRSMDCGIGRISLDKLGNIYVTGNINNTKLICGGANPDTIISAQNGADIMYCKLDNNGNLLWARTWDNNSPYDSTTISKVDNNGNLYIAGNSYT